MGRIRSCRYCGVPLHDENQCKGDARRRLRCRTCNVKRVQQYRDNNIERVRTYRQRSAAKLRAEVLSAYGGKCVCCGEDTPQFLAIDHVEKGGAEHRRSIGGGGAVIYRWLRSRNYPKDKFRLLCHNCNLARGFYGGCPHEKHGED